MRNAVVLCFVIAIAGGCSSGGCSSTSSTDSIQLTMVLPPGLWTNTAKSIGRVEIWLDEGGTSSPFATVTDLASAKTPEGLDYKYQIADVDGDGRNEFWMYFESSPFGSARSKALTLLGSPAFGTFNIYAVAFRQGTTNAILATARATTDTSGYAISFSGTRAVTLQFDCEPLLNCATATDGGVIDLDAGPEEGTVTVNWSLPSSGTTIDSAVRAALGPVELYFDEASAGAGLFSTATQKITARTFDGLPFEQQVVDVDADGRLEYSVRVLGNPFGNLSTWPMSFAGTSSIAAFTVRGRLYANDGGTLVAEATATTDSANAAIQFGAIAKYVNLNFVCVSEAACRPDGGGGADADAGADAGVEADGGDGGAEADAGAVEDGGEVEDGGDGGAEADAGAVADAGVEADGGEDGGEEDGGDGGAEADAGADAGPDYEDGGDGGDGGAEADAGADAGAEADAGADAGPDYDGGPCSGSWSTSLPLSECDGGFTSYGLLADDAGAVSYAWKCNGDLFGSHLRASESSTWEAPTTLGTCASGFTLVSFTIDPQGTATYTWTCGGDVRAARVHAPSTAWDSTTTLGSCDAGATIDLVGPTADRLGNTIVAWSCGVDAWVRRAPTGGSSWTAPELAVNHPAALNIQSLVEDDAGNQTLLWSTASVAPFYFNASRYLAADQRWDDAGRAIAVDGGSPTVFAAAVDPTGNLLVIASELNGYSQVSWYNWFSTTSGWSTPVRWYDFGAFGSTSLYRLSANADGTYHLVFDRTPGSNSQLQWRTFQPDGGYWSDAGTIESASDTYGPIALKVRYESSGARQLFWYRNTTLYHAAQPAGGTWAAPVSVSQNYPNTFAGHSFGWDLAGNALVSWMWDFAYPELGAFSMVANAFDVDAGRWGDAGIIDQDAGFIEYPPTLSVAGTGHGVVARVHPTNSQLGFWTFSPQTRSWGAKFAAPTFDGGAATYLTFIDTPSGRVVVTFKQATGLYTTTCP